jgi:small subunit ribosomal protein S17
VQKPFSRRAHLLVHDPNSSLRTGDIISITPGWRTSKTVHHVVSAIVAPFGEPIEARPPVPTLQERLETLAERRRVKEDRRRLRDLGRHGGESEGREEVESVGELDAKSESLSGYEATVDTIVNAQGAETEAMGQEQVKPVEDEKAAKKSWWQ